MNRSVFRIKHFLFTNSCHRIITRSYRPYYPIDDTLYNLSDEQIQVRHIFYSLKNNKTNILTYIF